jgi:Protein of unknown function (DUF4197)
MSRFVSSKRLLIRLNANSLIQDAYNLYGGFMKKTRLRLLMMLPLSICIFTSCDYISQLDPINPSTTELAETEIVSGLKEALVLGSKTAAFTLSDTSGTTNSLNEVTGYLANELIRISLPPDAEKAIATVNLLNSNTAGKALLAAAGIDFSQYRASMIRGLNRGAEKAAGLSVEVFKSAILGMTFTSARDILFGQDSTGAKKYLQTTTSGVLTSGFTPIVDSAFSAVKVTAFGSQFTVKGLWSDFSINYNKVATAYQTLKTNAGSSNLVTSLPASASLELIATTGVTSVDPLNTDIVNFATGKALDGLFYMVGKQEVKIRRDPVAALSSVVTFVTQTVSDLIKKVFTKTNT